MTVKSPFARLFRSAAAKATDEDEAAKRKGKRMADQEDADEDEAEDEVVEKVVDDAEDNLKDTADDGEDDPDAKRKARKKAKAKAKVGDDDTDEADDKDPKAKAARARERGRIAAIMASPAAQANPAGALFMALRTGVSRDTAIADLVALGPAAPSGRAGAIARLRGVDVPDVGAEGESRERSNTRATADAIIAAGRRARGEA